MLNRILFIIPPYINIPDIVYEVTEQRLPVFTLPYGVLSIASYLEAASEERIACQILDLNLHAYTFCKKAEKIEPNLARLVSDAIENLTPDIIGISCLFNSSHSYLGMITSTIRSVAPATMIVIGGGLASNLYQDVLADFADIHAACHGEGEIPLLELMSADDPAAYLRQADSWMTREGVASGKIPRHSLIQDLDLIPVHNYRLIDLNQYTGRALDKRQGEGNFRELSIHTTRGCPFKCVFCANGKLHGRKVRFMSVERVIAEVKRMVDQFALEVLLIEDDHFFADRKRAKRILKELAPFGIRIEFPNGLAVYGLDEETGYLLKQAGATTVCLAVESGSDYVLRHIINKPLKSSMVKPAVDILRGNGICSHAFFVVGLPGEEEQHRQETMDLIHDAGFDWCYFFLAIPTVGSRLYDLCKEKGLIVKKDYKDHIVTKCSIKLPGISPEELEQRAYRMNLEANFLQNSNLRSGNFQLALQYFDNVVRRYPEHAFAHYCLAQCYEGLGNSKTEADRAMSTYRSILAKSPTWRSHASHFGLV